MIKVLLIIPPREGDDIMSSTDVLLRVEALLNERTSLSQQLMTGFLPPADKKQVFNRLDSIETELVQLGG